MPTYWDLLIKPPLMNLYQRNNEAFMYQLPAVIAVSLLPWALRRFEEYQRRQRLAILFGDEVDRERLEREARELLSNRASYDPVKLEQMYAELEDRTRNPVVAPTAASSNMCNRCRLLNNVA
eukprot:2463392-Rhodomonas_salina.1